VKQLLLRITFLLLILGNAYGQVPVTTFPFSYNQSFTGPSPCATCDVFNLNNPVYFQFQNNQTYLGWYVSNKPGNANNHPLNGLLVFDQPLEYDNTGIMSMRFAGTDGALGGRPSTSNDELYYGVRFVNNSGCAINTIQVNFRLEQYTIAAQNEGSTNGQHAWDFSYSLTANADILNPNGWINVPSLRTLGLRQSTCGSGTTICSGGFIDGNLPANSRRMPASGNQVINLSSPWQPGAELFIRISDPDYLGNDHSYYIDDFNLSIPTGTGINKPVVSATSLTTISATRTDATILARVPSTGANGYLVVRTTDTTRRARPADFKVYRVGDTVGSGQVIRVQRSASTSFLLNETGLDRCSFAYKYILYPFNEASLESGCVAYKTRDSVTVKLPKLPCNNITITTPNNARYCPADSVPYRFTYATGAGAPPTFTIQVVNPAANYAVLASKEVGATDTVGRIALNEGAPQGGPYTLWIFSNPVGLRDTSNQRFFVIQGVTRVALDGPTIRCTNEATTDFTIDGELVAGTFYTPRLVPANAGTVTRNNETVTITWAANFSDTGYVYVDAINGCGAKPSDTIQVISRDGITLRATTDWNNLDCDTLAQFRLTDSLPAGVTPNWTIVFGNGGKFRDSNSSTAILEGKPGETYVVRLSVLPNLCLESSLNFTVNLRNKIPNPAVSDLGICNAGILKFQVPGTADTVIWYSDPRGFNRITDPTVNDSVLIQRNAGDTVLYVSNYSNGCRSLPIPVKGTIYTPEPVQVAFADTVVGLGKAVNLAAQGSVTYRWSPADGLSDTTVANPSASPLFTTTYTVTGTDANGCITLSQVIVRVDNKIKFPNVITVDGDGINDFWQVGEVPFKECNLEIFNRFGTKVYQDNNRIPKWTAENMVGGLYYITLSGTLADSSPVTYKGWVQVLK
jgi:hypothetical protein